MLGAILTLAFPEQISIAGRAESPLLGAREDNAGEGFTAKTENESP